MQGGRTLSGKGSKRLWGKEAEWVRASTRAQTHLSTSKQLSPGVCSEGEPTHGPAGSSCFSSCCLRNLCLTLSSHSPKVALRKQEKRLKLQTGVASPQAYTSPALGGRALCGWPRPGREGSQEGAEPLLQQVGPCLPHSESRLYLAVQISPSQSVVHGVMEFPRHFQGSEESKYFSNDIKTLSISFTMLTLARRCKGNSG